MNDLHVPALLVECAVDDGIATLTLNRAEQFNTLSRALIAEFQAHLEAIAADPAIRVIVVAARGKAFCAGHDLREIRALDDKAEIEALFVECSRLMQRLGTVPQPVIAKVQAPAAAAGCQLVVACDLAVAAASARFATPGINVGIFCATPSVPLGRAIARKHALEMLLTGELITAERAAEIGLINRAVADDKLDEAVLQLARVIKSRAPEALAMGKRIFAQQMDLPLSDAYALASEAIAADFVRDEARQGIDAFLAKRPPPWQ